MKKSLILILSIILIFIIFLIYKSIGIKKESSEEQIEISQSEEEVTDGCLDEWEDYNKYMGEKIEETSTNLVKEDTHYLLKDVWGFIEVYYLDENHNEYLYKKTSIATSYLSQEDVDDLKIGIEVVGLESLNKMLEDFE